MSKKKKSRNKINFLFINLYMVCDRGCYLGEVEITIIKHQNLVAEVVENT